MVHGQLQPGGAGYFKQLRRVVDAAVAAGRLPPEARHEVDLTAVPPTLAVRDRLRDAQADQILVRNGAMSPERMALRHGLEPAGGGDRG